GPALPAPAVPGETARRRGSPARPAAPRRGSSPEWWAGRGSSDRRAAGRSVPCHSLRRRKQRIVAVQVDGRYPHLGGGAGGSPRPQPPFDRRDRERLLLVEERA